MDLVLLHGINNTPRAFDAMRGALPDEIRVTAPHPPALDRVEAIAEAVLDALPRTFALAGHSFGGYIALAILARAPERVASLALIASTTRADSEAAANLREERAMAAEEGRYAELAEAASALTFHPDSLADDSLMALRAAEIRDYGAARYAAHQRACAVRPNMSARAAAFGGPKVVIAASHDVLMPPDSLHSVAIDIGAEFKTVAGAGHMLVCERPEEVATALVS